MVNHFSFISFGSGSSGNSYLIRTNEGQFLIDSGIGIRKISRYFVEYGIHPKTLSAIFLTHDHSDHVKSAGQLSAKYDIPIYATAKTWKGILNNPTIVMKAEVINHKTFVVGDVLHCCGCSLTTFSVPHDSNENVGYFIEYSGNHLCLITDAGHVTSSMCDYVSRANELILESNYDEDMLRTGSYPWPLKTRIQGENGHLSNNEAAEIVLKHFPHLNHVWLCHLSENNNTPQKAFDTIADCLRNNGIGQEEAPKVVVLKRRTPSEFFDLS